MFHSQVIVEQWWNFRFRITRLPWKGCDIKMSDIRHEFQGSGDWSFWQRADEIVHALLLCNLDEKVRTLQQEFLCKVTKILPGMCFVLDNEPSIKVLTQVLSHTQLLDMVPKSVYEIMEVFASYDILPSEICVLKIWLGFHLYCWWWRGGMCLTCTHNWICQQCLRHTYGRWVCSSGTRPFLNGTLCQRTFPSFLPSNF